MNGRRRRYIHPECLSCANYPTEEELRTRVFYQFYRCRPGPYNIPPAAGEARVPLVHHRDGDDIVMVPSNGMPYCHRPRLPRRT